MTPAEVQTLRSLALSLPVNEPPATSEEIAKHLEFMAATLPSRNADERTGKMKFAVYVSMLNGRTNAELKHMSRTVLAEQQWFPTPNQCIATFKSFTPGVGIREQAIQHCRKATQAMFDDFIECLKSTDVSTETLAAYPEQWLRIADEQCLVRKMDDGTYIQRKRKMIEQSEQ